MYWNSEVLTRGHGFSRLLEGSDAKARIATSCVRCAEEVDSNLHPGASATVEVEPLEEGMDFEN